MIQYNDQVMKPGIDSVLLGSVASRFAFSKAIDLGCGSGILSLMLSRSNKSSNVTGLDVDSHCISVCMANTSANSDLGPLEFICSDMFEFGWDRSGTYDLVVSNPPYFIGQLDSSNASRSLQRHWSMDQLKKFAGLCSSLLARDGRLVIVLPVYAEKTWTMEFMMKGLYLQSELRIRHRAYSPCSVSILTYGFTLDRCVIEYLELYDENDQYSKKYLELCGSFIRKVDLNL